MHFLEEKKEEGWDGRKGRKTFSSSPLYVIPEAPVKLPPPSLARQDFILRLGAERTVSFLSESLGVALNRCKCDGFVRVVYVVPDEADYDKWSPQTSTGKRMGQINVGDIVLEAAGIDLRRPIAQYTWAYTVRMIKIAQRPLRITVAEELSAKPHEVLGEMEAVKRQPKNIQNLQQELQNSSFSSQKSMTDKVGTPVELWETALSMYPEIVAKHGEFSGQLLQAMLGTDIDDEDEALMSGKKAMSKRTLKKGSCASVFFSEPPVSKLPSSAKALDVVTGNAFFASGERSLPGDGKRPGGFPISYTVGPKPEKSSSSDSNDGGGGEIKEERTMNERLDEPIRDLKDVPERPKAVGETAKEIVILGPSQLKGRWITPPSQLNGTWITPNSQLKGTWISLR